MTTAPALTPDDHVPPSHGGRLVSADGRALPLRGTSLAADARGGIVRVRLEQRFKNHYPEPLSVTYLFALPHAGAVSGLAFRAGDRRVVGEIDRLAAARQLFEEALLEGRSAALLEQERASVFTQSLGHLPPGEELVVEIEIDQPLDFAAGDWVWRFPTALAPRYLAGGVEEPQRVTVDVVEGDLDARLSLSLLVRDVMPAGGVPASPSHAIRHLSEGDGLKVTLAAEEGGSLDRDLVVRWPVAVAEAALSIDCGRPRTGRLDGRRAFGLITLVPPEAGTSPQALARDLILLLDTSGSMQGRPLEQAKAIAEELVRSLGEGDSLELVAFSSVPRRFRASPTPATPARKSEALRWLSALSASGGTEMREGVLAALRPLRGDTQRQVVLVTDGLIGAEREVIGTVLGELPAASRLHVVAVGEAVNRSLSTPLARAGRGLELVVGLADDPRAAAVALVARTARPLVTNLSVEGSALKATPPWPRADLFGGAPLLVPVELAPAGGEIVVRGTTASGPFERRHTVAPVAAGAGSPAAAALFAREAIEALELELAAGEPEASVDPRIEALGLEFQISTRLTAWVAVSEEPTVDPTRPFRRERMPQMLPRGLSVAGLGLRPAGLGAALAAPPRLALERSAASGFGPSAAGHRLRVPSAGPSVPRQKASAPERPGPAVPALTATARRRGDRWVVEVEVERGMLAWEVPDEVTLIFSAGAAITCRVDASRTTAAGSVAAGRSVRLVLLGAGPGAGHPASLVVHLGGEALTLPLS